MKQILDIENLCFEFPWSEEDFLETLKYRHMLGFVLEEDQIIKGFFIQSLHKHEIHLLTLAVDPHFQDEGYGTAMVDKLKDKLDKRKHSLITKVRESNLSAQLFFKNRGFECITVLRDDYNDTDEDGYLFKYSVKDKKKKSLFTNRITQHSKELD